MLHNVYAPLVKEYGSRRLRLPIPMDQGATSSSFTFLLTLLLSNLAILHVRSTFFILSHFKADIAVSLVVSAREAWIQTDKNRYNGANKFLLWEAFASLGLGVNANNYVDDSSVLAGCNLPPPQLQRQKIPFLARLLPLLPIRPARRSPHPHLSRLHRRRLKSWGAV
jgi:extracellular elastinolytic metalloproteinase